ncbi:MAG: hypothetical protein U0R17_07615 [Acidimicrobiia bacterium]
MFDEIKGQDRAIEVLKLAFVNPVNTYLFIGTRGIFIEQVARNFASYLLNKSGVLDERIVNQIHPDVIEFMPFGVNYRVKEDVRDSMLSELRKSPIESNSKVAIIHDAHLLRSDSANALLKSLEEPGANFYWILIAPSIDSVLPTIRSRCFEVEFSRISNEQISEQLDDAGINQDKIDLISALNLGRIDRAQNLATQYFPLLTCVKNMVKDFDKSGSYVASKTQVLREVFDEISQDVISNNKKHLEQAKENIKNAGYEDKVAKKILSDLKTKSEQQEKRLRSDLMKEFLDLLERYVIDEVKSSSSKFSVEAPSVIQDYKKRLLFNPSENLFIESLLSSLCLNQIRVNL